nr:unnamed protein product [uncultured bacterium]
MRVQVNLSDELVGAIDVYAKKMGVSRSAFCSVMIGQGVMGYDQSMKLLTDIGDKIGDSLLAENQLQKVLEKDKETLKK